MKPALALITLKNFSMWKVIVIAHTKTRDLGKK